MKPLIKRILFWFNSGDESLMQLDHKFSPWARMFTRLLTETYSGRKIQFINLYFSTEQTYILHPVSPKHHVHYYGGHLRYNDVLDLDAFLLMNEKEKLNYVWKRAADNLLLCANSIQNIPLSVAVTSAYEKGIACNLNPDFEILQTNIVLNEKLIEAAIKYTFKQEKVIASLVLKAGGATFFEHIIDAFPAANPFVFEIYKKIEVKNNKIIIKGLKDAGNLPLKLTAPQL